MPDTYQPTTAPSQPPAPTAAPTPSKTRAPREVPVQLLTVTLPDRNVEGEPIPSQLQWRFIVEGTEAQARDWLSARFVQVRRATPQDLIDAGRDGVPFEKAVAA